MALLNIMELDLRGAQSLGEKPSRAEQANLIDRLLDEQRSLSAVERFSQKHAAAKEHLLQRHYQDLIPIRKPSSGEQYAFEVDLDKCTGCKACVVACHSMNGLHDNESWRDVGSIRGVVNGKVEQQTVTTACHHCADPACLSGCPVGAYEKMPDTGVVRHLDDQCIGCQYCSLKCPYGVPKYDRSLGIVRKCDMCHERLAEGEAPACVQACPNGAIKIKLVSHETIREAAKDGASMLPGSYRSDYTFPSTVYKSRRDLSHSMHASDEHELRPSHGHPPLVWMLMLTQVAVGLSVVDFLGRLLAPMQFAPLHLSLVMVAVVLGLAGLFSSMLHLGSPLGAWRVFLGLRTSWLSREVIAFGGWMPVLMSYAALEAWPHLYPWMPAGVQAVCPQHLPGVLAFGSSATAVFFGLVSVFCSVMVYVDTKRAFWSMWKTCGRFAGTTLLGGGAVLLAVEVFVKNEVSLATSLGFFIAACCKIGVELSLLLPARHAEWSYAKKSALLQLKPLGIILAMRWCALAIGLIGALLAVWQPVLFPAAALVAVMAIFAGEWLERKLFFEAVVTLKMPGEHNRVAH